MNKDKLKATLFDIGKDIVIAFVIVCIVMLALFAYCGIWPPMVVVESGSMQRYDDRSVVGVIDTGDMVFVKKLGNVNDLVTYVDGEAMDYSRYGTYGDVIIYRPNGLSNYSDGTVVVPIIHRLVVWLEVNSSKVSQNSAAIDFANYSFDVPSLGLYGTTDDIVLEDYGFWNQRVTIVLNLNNGLLRWYQYRNMVPHGGFITMGDHNVPSYDQPMSGSYEPVLPEWIVGKAIGEIPWFGLVKLKVTGANVNGVPGNSWTNLFITLGVVLFIPFAFDFIVPRLKAWRKGNVKGAEEVTGQVVAVEGPPGEAAQKEAQEAPESPSPGKDKL